MAYVDFLDTKGTPVKTLAEIEADIAALTNQKNLLREQAKAKARPRLDEIKTQVEALIAEAIKIIDDNGVYDFSITLKPSTGRYGTKDTLSYSYGSFRGDGYSWDTSAWESSSSNC